MPLIRVQTAAGHETLINTDHIIAVAKTDDENTCLITLSDGTETIVRGHIGQFLPTGRPPTYVEK